MPSNLACRCTANQPITESLSSIVFSTTLYGVCRKLKIRTFCPPRHSYSQPAIPRTSVSRLALGTLRDYFCSALQSSRDDRVEMVAIPQAEGGSQPQYSENIRTNLLNDPSSRASSANNFWSYLRLTFESFLSYSSQQKRRILHRLCDPASWLPMAVGES